LAQSLLATSLLFHAYGLKFDVVDIFSDVGEARRLSLDFFSTAAAALAQAIW